MMSTKLKALIIAVVIAIAISALCLSACANEPFRLHIIANSNSEQDQKVKLVVRDAVLNATEQGIKQCSSALEAEEYVKKNLEIILETANKTLGQQGFEYTASASLGNYHFPEKSYRGATYPEGDYDALRIILGEGKGDNWWCVMFPPLCLYEIEDMGDYDAESVEYTSFFADLMKMIFGEQSLP